MVNTNLNQLGLKIHWCGRVARPCFGNALFLVKRHGNQSAFFVHAEVHAASVENLSVNDFAMLIDFSKFAEKSERVPSFVVPEMATWKWLTRAEP